MVIAGNNTVNPIKYLENTSLSGTHVAVEFNHRSSRYSFYLRGKKLLYATNSVLSHNILERHLKRLSHDVPRLKSIWNKLNLKLDQEDTQLSKKRLSSEFRKIIWLADKEYLDSQQLSSLGAKISQEIIESLLLIDRVLITDIQVYEYKVPNVCQHNLHDTIVKAQHKVTQWQKLLPEIESTYQRPYLGYLSGFDDEKNETLSKSDRQKLGKILKGFNFRELGALLNIDELSVAQRLYPLIQKQLVILRYPKNQLSKLPEITTKILESQTKQSAEQKTSNSSSQNPSSSGDNILLTDDKVNKSNKQYKIACIDDSLTVLNSIKEFLVQDNISVFPINNAAKAMMLMNRIQPDLIFMDIGMPLIDGYQLCSLLRKNTSFKNIPIIMLTGNTGIINRAKAKMSGATDYMTKPFTQEDLLDIAFRYLSDF